MSKGIGELNIKIERRKTIIRLKIKSHCPQCCDKKISRENAPQDSAEDNLRRTKTKSRMWARNPINNLSKFAFYRKALPANYVVCSTIIAFSRNRNRQNGINNLKRIYKSELRKIIHNTELISVRMQIKSK